MNIIGRKMEQAVLSDCLDSRRPEFVAVYGRRRVGKTYLIREFFSGRFSFYATGVSNQKTKEQLGVFHECLKKYGSPEAKPPKNWMEAFGRLKELMESDAVYREPVSGKRIIFLDELPWMATARSDFINAFDFFWNGWASAEQDILLIICGSAASWVIDHLLMSTGGFHNRITRQIHLSPFTLGECEQLLISNGLPFQRRQIMESYMVFGGIPYYLNYLDRRLSLSQNIDILLFDEHGPLRHEYSQLFQSLFRKAKKHIAVIEAMAARRSGVTRTELARVKEIGDGEPLTKTLLELEQCGFIRKYKNYSKLKQGFFYQLIDPFVLFSLRFVHNSELGSWLAFQGSPGYYAWRGLSFELLCLNHIPQIKASLGISGVQSTEYSWKSAQASPGTQIDLIIDRRDEVINLCEMKYYERKAPLDSAMEKGLLYKLEVFRRETAVKKAIHITMITDQGIERNEYSQSVINEVTGDELFESARR